MVDIHCHILPGLDDGPDSFETSVQMAEMAIADGITHVVATPHSDNTYRFDPVLVRARRDELQDHVGDRLHLATGCDFHLSFENIQDLRNEPAKYTINQKDFLLVEFANFAIPPGVDDALHSMHIMGLSPIITHPERNALIRAKPEMLHAWISRGCYVQVTAQSFLGRFGGAARGFAETLLEHGCIHFIASDAHNVGSRPLQLRPAYEAVRKLTDEETAGALLRENPLAAYEGRSLPYVAEPPEKASVLKSRRRKRFFFF
jgi:protein-tyrosine phosphatase